ncbi:MAG: PEP/pyruvate-binding domain-containing protein [bacterium]
MSVWERISGQPEKPGREIVLKTLCARFRRVQANRRVFENLIRDAGEKLGGGYVLDRQYLASVTDEAFALGGEIVTDMNALSSRRDADLYRAMDRMKKRLRHVLAWRPLVERGDLIIPFDEIDEIEHYHSVGGMITRLAEVRRLPGVLMPEGFVFSFAAFDLFARYNGIESPHDAAVPGRLKNLSNLRRKILDGAFPAELRTGVEAAVAAMQAFHDTRLKFILTASAFGDEYGAAAHGEHAAPAYGSAENVLNSYKKILASMFEDDAVMDRIRLGLDPMGHIAVAATRMIEPRVQGRVLTVNPASPFSGRMRVEEEGDGETVRFELNRISPHEISGAPPEQSAAPQGERFFIGLTEKAMLVERCFRSPREITWVCDRNGDLYITGVAPLSISADAMPATGLADALARRETLYDGTGKTASPGIAFGTVRVVSGETGFENIPGQCVIVTERITQNEGFIRCLQRAAAVLADGGAPDEAAVSSLRKLHVPTIVGLGDATSRLRDGDTVTVDADDNVIYKGMAEELLNYQLTERLNIENEREYTLLRFLLHYISQGAPAARPAQRLKSKKRDTLEQVVRTGVEGAARGLIGAMESIRRKLAGTAARLEPVRGVRLYVAGAADSPALSAVLGGLSESPGEGGKSGFPASVLAVTSFGNTILYIASGPRAYLLSACACDAAERNYIYLRISDRTHPNDLSEKRVLWLKGVLEKYDFNVYQSGGGMSACRDNMPSDAAKELLTLLGRMLRYAEGGAAAKDLTIESEIEKFFMEYGDCHERKNSGYGS